NKYRQLLNCSLFLLIQHARLKHKILFICQRRFMNIVFFSFIILIAAILQTSTGFGFSIFATPFLLLLFTLNDAIQINLILSFFISLTFFTNIIQDVYIIIFCFFISDSSIVV